MVPFDSIINQPERDDHSFRQEQQNVLHKQKRRGALQEKLPRHGRQKADLSDCRREEDIPLIRKTITEERSFRGKSVSIDMGRQINVDFSLSPFYLHDTVEGAILSLSENLSLADREAHDQESLVYLLGSISHEIKNPLGGIKGAAQLLSMQTRDASLHEYTDLIIRETDRLNAILHDYLTICRKPSFHP